LEADDEARAVMENMPRQLVMSRDGAPRWESYLDAELVNRSVTARAEAANPQAFAELHDPGLFRAALAGVIASARAALTQAVPSAGCDEHTRRCLSFSGRVCHGPSPLRSGSQFQPGYRPTNGIGTGPGALAVRRLFNF
jgi:hypothetical protein